MCMGEAALSVRPGDEVASMVATRRRRHRSGGAMGFSSSQATVHLDHRRAAGAKPAGCRRPEIEALVDVVGRYGIGSLAMAPYSTLDGLDQADCDRHDRLRQPGRRAGDLPGLWRTKSAQSTRSARGDGSRLARPLGVGAARRSTRSS